MKKIAILLVMVIGGIAFAQAQSHKVVSAYNYLRKSKLEKALEAIEEAKDHKRTENEAKTWYYRGNVYLTLHNTEKEEYKDLVEGALDSAFYSYKKAMDLDEKDKYTDEIKDRIKFVSEQYFNNGVTNYKSKDYDQAMKGFTMAATINEQYRDKIDTAAFYYAGNSADLAGHKDKALKYYKKAKKYKFDNPRIYSSLSRLYSTKGDTAKAFEVVKQGKKRYPDNYDLTITETNLYLAKGETQKALDNLKVAVKQDSTNPELWFASGVNYEKMMKEQEADSIKETFMDEAINAYQKAIELDNEYYEPAFNLGAIFVNRAAELQKKANALPLEATEKYEALKKQADSLLKKAVPHLEKAREIRPDDINTLQSLKEIYARLNKAEKLKEVNKRIQELTGAAKQKGKKE
ncbi:MAG: hypothetical protein K9J27_07115 [Bacteroidales bacterium]|nr:hypothetical protein [Bacteroidales bacterium]MCF8333546.1 hypothetical protein [Bacteroidales bacterium]